jgi:hypothetical protein
MTDAMVLSTDGLPPGETAPAWHAWMSQLFAGLDTDLYGDRLFEGHVRVANAGDVVLTRLEAGRHRVMRSMQGLRAQESPYLKIVAPWEGVASVRQHNREASVRRGSWVIYDTSQEYEVANPEWSEHLIVMLPRQAIVDRGIRLEGLMGRNVGGSSGIARIASCPAWRRIWRAARANCWWTWSICRCRSWPGRARPARSRWRCRTASAPM